MRVKNKHFPPSLHKKYFFECNFYKHEDTIYLTAIKKHKYKTCLTKYNVYVSNFRLYITTRVKKIKAYIYAKSMNIKVIET